ncbi:hypothetical protein [Bradyrhizobium neotropicale]|uniref:Uncharacterized protein n=1 Tax=Bradyrhizobium neotropicale TaxID=1497615 RepID=A0A176ZJC9_9BRAD|nr:hypothetical protein [Bradyrhizobium neotropicale]OAF19992.1 hypothetical protein AXW67_34180 [Bradyrhizobium neotropicale]
MRILGLILRTLFLLVVIVVTVRVASPQTESLWSAYDTPSDMFRFVLGVAVGGFIAFQIFQYPKSPAEMRKWVPIGLAVLPLALLCAAVIW